MLNGTTIKGLETVGEFVEVAHPNLTIPNLLILYVAFVSFFLIIGLIVASESKTKFFALFILNCILAGIVLIIQIMFPQLIYRAISFIGSFFIVSFYLKNLKGGDRNGPYKG